MERNLQPGSGMSHGNSSVGRIPKALLCQGPLSPEQLADILDEPHTRRVWWLNLHTGCDLRTGTTISDLESAVAVATTAAGSNGQPAAAPVSFAEGVNASSVLLMPLCECKRPVASIRPFDWQCAMCKGVIPALSNAEAL